MFRSRKLLSRPGRRADEVEAAALTAVRSAPFDPPERGRVAVIVITRTGTEMTSVAELTSDRRGGGVDQCPWLRPRLPTVS